MGPDVATPRRQSRIVGLPFASRRSPYMASQLASARRRLNRDDPPTRSGLSSSVLSVGDRAFGAKSSLNASARPTATPAPRTFSLDVFAPAASPAPKKLFRGSVMGEAQATPARKVATATAATSSKTELFKLNIPEPPAHLTGASLANKVPDYLQQRGSVYADQYLADICPAEFNEDQRRQFFCILDLRRLKYAADEIFAQKDWKLNVMNFAKEFDKSRSMIMLRYGLYEFKNVKPSEEVLRKWRAAHGLPSPDPRARSNGTTSVKRKAEEQLVQDSALSATSPNKSKRRLTEKDDVAFIRNVVPLSASTPASSKRKATVVDVDDDVAQPAKTPRSKTLEAFTNVYSNLSNGSTPPPKRQNIAPTTKSADGASSGNTRMAITTKPAVEPTKSFGHISDASDDADSDGSGAEADSPAQKANSATAKKPQASPRTLLNSATQAPSETATEPATGRSLFDRIDKGLDGQPIRMQRDTSPVRPEKPTNQTWNMSTPVKFAMPTTTSTSGVNHGLFGGPSTATSSIFAPKPTTVSETDGPEEKAIASLTADKTLNESDKENSSKEEQMKSAKPVDSRGAPAQPPSLFSQSTSTLLGAKKDDTATVTPAKPTSNLFGSLTSAPGFGGKTAGSGLFPDALGAKPTDKPTLSLFNFDSTHSSASSSLFKPKTTDVATAEAMPTETPDVVKEIAKPATPNLFGSSAATTGPNLFQHIQGGAGKDSDANEKGTSQEKEKLAQPVPSFSFGAPSKDSSKTETTSSTLTSSLFQGSFGAPTVEKADAKPATFSFGGAPQSEAKPSTLFSTSSSKPETSSTSLFGGTSQQSETKSAIFGSQSDKPSFTFGTSSQTSVPPRAKTPPITTNPFTFGATSTPAPKPAEDKSIMDAPTGELPFGSPMKTDDPSPVKPSSSGAVAPANGFSFSFGGGSTNAPPPPPQSSSIFANSGSGQTNTSSIFSQSMAPTASASSSFTFKTGGESAGQSFNNPFANVGNTNTASTPGPFNFNFGGANNNPSSGPTITTHFNPGLSQSATPTPSTSFDGAAPTEGSRSFTFGAGGSGGAPVAPAAPRTLRGKSPGTGTIHGRPIATPSKRFGVPRAQPPVPQSLSTPQAFPSFQTTQVPQASQPQAMPQPQSIFKFESNSTAQPAAKSIFENPQLASGGASTAGTNSPFLLGGSSIATTSATGTPEPERATDTGAADDDNASHDAQIDLTGRGQGEENEEILHEVRAKVLKYNPPTKDEGANGDDDKDQTKNPWSTQGIGPLRLLRHKQTGLVRLLLRGEPRGNIVLNRSLIPSYKHEANEKYVRVMTANETGHGLETWMLQVKTKESAKELATVLEVNKKN